jgi:hypothetical protein
VAAFLANVGVNAGHAARSPLFSDGTFQLVPIPERQRWRPPMLRVRDISGLARYTPLSWRNRAVHLDPDLDSRQPTYGDNCRRAGRAYSLRQSRAGDLIFFLARLQPTDSPAGFYLVGVLEIEDVLADATHDPGAGWWDGNAHIRRARAGGEWDSFWVFKGTPKTRRFDRAIPVTREGADHVFDHAWLWRTNRSELQTIGSYTRAVRRIEGRGEEWLRISLR